MTRTQHQPKSEPAVSKSSKRFNKLDVNEKKRNAGGRAVGARPDRKPSCALCKHPDRLSIEDKLKNEVETLKSIAISSGLSLAVLRAHQRRCMPILDGKTREILEAAMRRPLAGLEGNPFTDRVRLVELVGYGLLVKCEVEGDKRNAGAIMGQLLRCAELIGKQRGDLVDRRETNTVHHGGVVVLGVPAVSTAQQRRVIAAPRDGDRVSAAVASADHTLVELEAEIVAETAETPENGPSGEKNAL
jgi:hypothetical protein